MRKSIMILLVSLSLSSCKGYIQPDVWIQKDDGRLRASQRNEDFSLLELLNKIEKEEGKRFLFCVSPGGSESITNEIKSCKIELSACEQRCR